jgi:tetratricopeptide (TPR) repeat protein
MKKLAMTMIVGGMIASTVAFSFADAKPMEHLQVASAATVDCEINDCDTMGCDITGCELMEDISFQEFMQVSKEYLKTVDPKSENEMKVLYEAAVKLEKAKSYQEADIKWDAFFEIYDNFVEGDLMECGDFDDCELYDGNGDYVIGLPSFDEYMDDLSEILRPISQEDQEKLENLYKKLIKMEIEGKYETAEGDWEIFFKILDGYIKE